MTFIVAEMSASHNGSLERALDIVDAAADAGANAIKIQCWHPDRMVVDKSAMVAGGPWGSRNLYKLYEECRLPWEWIPDIATRAKEQGIEWFASVFDELALLELERLGCPRYKIASCEIVDLPLIYKVAATSKPLIISAGMATQGDIVSAYATALKHNLELSLTFLKCTAAYPAPIDECHLRTIPDMRFNFGVDIGLSDHTLGTITATTAVALGATVIEKHLTLSRADGGPDAGFASEPHEFAEMVKACREVERALGEVRYGSTPEEASTLRLRRSMYYNRDIPAGSTITGADIVSARPAGGILPDEARNVIGRCIKAPALMGQSVRYTDFVVK